MSAEEKAFEALSPKSSASQDRRESVSSKNTNDSLNEDATYSFNEELFEDYFRKYYVNSADNSNLNFDRYIQSALKLISKFPNQIFFKGEIEKKKISLSSPSQNKKTLILDLDETLLHADIDFNFKFHDDILKFIREETDEEILIPLILRPHLFDFLNFASEHFELVIFTASEKNYADAIIDYIEKEKKYFSKRLYRNNCIYLHPCLYIKDLSLVSNRNVKDIVIVDNSMFSFAFNLSNGILISSFFNDKNDSMLLNLSNYLRYLLNAEDVRTVNKENFQFEHYLNAITKENLI